MNHYNYVFGFHTPERSERLSNLIKEKTSIKWEDSSWHNDMCDSMEHDIIKDKNVIKLFIPNSDITDHENEKWSCFSLQDQEQVELLLTEDIEEVIKYINNNY